MGTSRTYFNSNSWYGLIASSNKPYLVCMYGLKNLQIKPEALHRLDVRHLLRLIQ